MKVLLALAITPKEPDSSQEKGKTDSSRSLPWREPLVSPQAPATTVTKTKAKKKKQKKSDYSRVFVWRGKRVSSGTCNSDNEKKGEERKGK